MEGDSDDGEECPTLVPAPTVDQKGSKIPVTIITGFLGTPSLDFRVKNWLHM